VNGGKQSIGKKSNALLSGAGNLSNGTIGGNNHGYGPLGGGLQGIMQVAGVSGNQGNLGGFQGMNMNAYKQNSSNQGQLNSKMKKR